MFSKLRAKMLCCQQNGITRVNRNKLADCQLKYKTLLSQLVPVLASKIPRAATLTKKKENKTVFMFPGAPDNKNDPNIERSWSCELIDNKPGTAPIGAARTYQNILEDLI